MVAIVSRAGKGSPLTNAEVDANFANLNNGKVETNSGAVIAALGYTPYNATNPGNFLDQAGVRGSFSVTGDLTYNSTTGVFGVNVPVTSVAGKTGAVTLTTSDVSEGTNQYFTQARARSAISASGSLSYNSSTGVLSFTDAVTSVFGRTGAVVLQSGDVTGALGFTPYNATNPSGYITASASITGNAATATALQTARLIGGVSFNGTANINLPGVNTAGNQSTSGNAATATTATNANNVAIAADTTSTTSFFVPYVSATTGNVAVRGTRLTVQPSTGNFTAAGTLTANSDERLKTDWLNLPSDFIERLSVVKCGTYKRIDTGVRQAGSSAQDWQKLLPEVISEDEEGILSLGYGNAALVAVVELAKRVLELEQKLAVTNQNIAEVRGK